MTYNQNFYNELERGSYNSAKIIVPSILELVKPKSVVDVGCGTGIWLRRFLENNISEVYGVDYWTSKERVRLKIPKSLFLNHNLENPLKLKRKFDCALSLEVAEHISPRKARVYIQNLVKLAPIVVFSAALPYQGGTNHINEQWPFYWSTIFADFSYKAFDCFREKLWVNDVVEWWYAQNMLLFVKDAYLGTHLKLAKTLGKPVEIINPLIHPSNSGSMKKFRL